MFVSRYKVELHMHLMDQTVMYGSSHCMIEYFILGIPTNVGLLNFSCVKCISENSRHLVTVMSSA